MPKANPFPGMNPWLERRWDAVHAALIAYAHDRLNEILPDCFQAQMQERVFIETFKGPGRSFYPDVHVHEQRRPPGVDEQGPGEGGTSVATLTVTDPIVIHVADAEIKEPYLEILDAGSGGRVVTSIEFVSRSNKAAGPGRELYIRKQHDVQAGGVNLVEVDLLRGGQSVTLPPRYLIPETHLTPYHVSVWRANRPDRIEYYAAPLRRRLPAVRIPLRPSDPDVVLDLQGLIDLAYVRGRHYTIDYTQPPQPPLSDEDAAWAAEVVKRIATGS